MNTIKKFQTINLKDVEIEPSVLSFLTPACANRFKIIPIVREKETLVLAAPSSSLSLISEIKFMLDMDVNIKVASQDDIAWALAKYYNIQSDEVDQYIEKVNKELKDEEDKDLSAELPIIKLVDMILVNAVSDRASDIHLEPYKDGLRVRYRIDGVLYDTKHLPPKLSLPIISRIKVLSSLDISETRLPQDGRISFKVNDTFVDLRVSTLPTVLGESVVMRVLDKSNIALSLNEIGLSREEETKIKELIKYPNGIILTTGPTGSGKTTTLYSMIKELNKIDVKIITTEDPVEYDLDGIIQVAASSKIGLDFVKSLRHILRQDPDIIMVGEIRDSQTANIAVQSSLTGHLVLSTLHTNDAPSSITRLLDMGIEPFLITSTVNAIVAQRLARTLCNACKKKTVPSVRILNQVGLKPEDVGDKIFYEAVGCKACNNTGYKGRVGIFEILIMNDTVRSLIIKGARTTEIKRSAQENGMRLLIEDALEKVYDGVTSLEEIVNIC